MLLGVNKQNFWQLWISRYTRFIMFYNLFPGICSHYSKLGGFHWHFFWNISRNHHYTITKIPIFWNYLSWPGHNVKNVVDICLKNSFLMDLFFYFLGNLERKLKDWSASQAKRNSLLKKHLGLKNFLKNVKCLTKECFSSVVFPIEYYIRVKYEAQMYKGMTP